MINATQVNDTTITTTGTNYSIYVTTIDFDVLNITNETIEFYNITSLNTRITNTNLTGNAIVQLYGIQVGLTVRNHNTSTDLFTSTSSNSNYNVTFGQGVQIRILGVQDTGTIGGFCLSIIEGFSLFGLFLGLIGLAVVAVFVYSKVNGMNNEGFLVPSIIALVLATVLIVIGVIVTNSVCQVA